MTNHIRRREFITLFGGAAAVTPAIWPHAARAQQAGKVWRVAFLAAGSRPVSIESGQYGGFPQGMRELGHVEGKDFVIEWRFSEGRPELFPGLAVELVRAQVDMSWRGVRGQPVRCSRRAAPYQLSWLFRPIRW